MMSYYKRIVSFTGIHWGSKWLFQQQHLPSFSIIARLQPIEIYPRRNVFSFPDDLMITGWLRLIQQRLNLAAEDVIDLDSEIRCNR